MKGELDWWSKNICNVLYTFALLLFRFLPKLITSKLPVSHSFVSVISILY